MIPPGRVALYLERRLDKGLVSIHPRPLAVGPVGGLGAEIAIGPHRAVAVIAAEGALRCIHRDVVEVDAEAVALGVAVGEARKSVGEGKSGSVRVCLGGRG